MYGEYNFHYLLVPLISAIEQKAAHGLNGRGLNSNSSGLKFIDGGTITQAEAQSADQAAQIVFDNKIPVSEGIIVFVNFIFAFRYSMIVQKYGRGDYGAYILFGCNVPTLTYHTKTAGTWN